MKNRFPMPRNKRPKLTPYRGISTQDLLKIKQEAFEMSRAEISDVSSTWLLAAFALALHRDFRFGQQRIMKALEAVDRVAGELDGKPMEEVVQLVEDEAGVRITNSGGDLWR